VDDQLQRLLEVEARAQALIDDASQQRQRMIEEALAAVREAEARFEAGRAALRAPFLNEATGAPNRCRPRAQYWNASAPAGTGVAPRSRGGRCRPGLLFHSTYDLPPRWRRGRNSAADHTMSAYLNPVSLYAGRPGGREPDAVGADDAVPTRKPSAAAAVDSGIARLASAAAPVAGARITAN
jgi:hypothetical protein